MVKSLVNGSDIVILLLVSIVVFWLYSILWFNGSQQGRAETLLVQFADNSPLEYSLNQDKIISINGKRGPSIIEIKQGKARFIHSSCRNQFCVFHGWLTTPSATSACLPNRISISLSGSLANFDAIAGSQ